ncbi:type II toxin-antitoxin system RelE family toxin [Candidatus Wolbachia massiliensis]|uniref:Type II toxin-antitoxin system RelE/ParE family toxin n=1 Tax=Candidatus Wolbachia massiliensis TaxID=1845000 RepID=A0A7M3U379_9RICK|nr:type II toxin-antitoxin system RelE/ParE family toxin [Candidatus Wolbachia massiliensis]
MYKIELSKRYAKEDFPALPEGIKSDVEEDIEKELKVNPNKAGKPLRGKLQGYRRLRFDKYRLIHYVNTPKRKVFIIIIGHRDNVYKQTGLLNLLLKL